MRCVVTGGDGEPSLFNILHELGWHLAQRIADGEAEEAKRVLLVVEETLRSGSETAIHASTIGLLESLQNSKRTGAIQTSGPSI